MSDSTTERRGGAAGKSIEKHISRRWVSIYFLVVGVQWVRDMV